MRYTADFLPGRQATRLLDWTLDETSIAWQRERFSIFGKPCDAPRRLAWCGDAGVNYRYTGLDHLATGWFAPLVALREKVERVCGLHFNFLLLNRYDIGQDHMGWHRDDEHGAAPTIASVSLGQTRRFRHRPRAGVPSAGLDLEHGSLLVFNGGTQHMLARTSRNVGTRINLTFRNIAPGD